MSPSPGQTLRAAFLRLTRLLGLVFACVAAGALAGPWQTPAPSPCVDAQVVAVPAHDVPAAPRHEPAPAPSEESEDDEETVTAAAQAHPPHPTSSRDADRSHDALGPPSHALDVETPPPRA